MNDGGERVLVLANTGRNVLDDLLWVRSTCSDRHLGLRLT